MNIQEGAAGACGNVNDDSTPLVALPSNMYADGKHCGKHVLIKNTANGKTVVAKVQDMCPGCPSSTSLDVSFSLPLFCTFERSRTKKRTNRI